MKIEWSKIVYPVTVGIILAIIIPIFSSYKSVSKFLLELSYSIWASISSPITVPLWLFIIIIAALIPYIVRLVNFIIPSKIADWLDYTEDWFFLIHWRWKYHPRDDTIYDLLPYCPIDDTLLVIQENWPAVKIYCETCGEEFGHYEGGFEILKGKVLRQIDRKIRAEEWKRP